jgi:hypothetical protein
MIHAFIRFVSSCVLLCLLAACATRQPPPMPAFPIPLSVVRSETGVPHEPVGVMATHDLGPIEINLRDAAFAPPLAQALQGYLLDAVGSRAICSNIVMTRATVKVRVMTAPSAAPEATVAGMRGVPPGTSPAAGLVGGLIASALIDSIEKGREKALVLASVEGRVGDLEFAGFEFVPYDPEAREASVEAAVLAAFEKAAASLNRRLSSPDVSPATTDSISSTTHDAIHDLPDR